MYQGTVYRGYRLMPHSSALAEIPLRAASECIGARYWWGKGSLSSAQLKLETHKPRPSNTIATWIQALDFNSEYFDCSGLVCWLMERTRQMLPSLVAPTDAVFWNTYNMELTDYNSSGARLLCDPTDQVSPGCLVFYNKHIDYYVGRGMVAGCIGGGRNTKGDNQLACVQLRPFGYRAGILMVGKPKPEYKL